MYNLDQTLIVMFISSDSLSVLLIRLDVPNSILHNAQWGRASLVLPSKQLNFMCIHPDTTFTIVLLQDHV